MPSTLTLTLDQLAAGDVIVAIDDRKLDIPVVVASPLGATGVAGVETFYDSPAGVARYLYRDVVSRAVTVEREPEQEIPAAKPARKTRRKPAKVVIRRHGIPLERGEDSIYRTEDGRYEILLNPGYITLCEAPHNVRAGEGSYRCPGNIEHEYSRWVIWDTVTDDYLLGADGGFDTFGEAARVVSALYG